MATVTEKRHTPEDLLKITDRLMPELVDGELVEREPKGQRTDAVAVNLVAELLQYAETTLPGLVNGSQGSYQIFPDDLNKVRIPDVSFTRRDRLPDGKPAKGHGRVAPDLAVEVVSPRDSVAKLMKKVRDFFRAGIPLVWVLHPDLREVQVFRPDGSSYPVREGETLDGGDVLPGFSCPVAALFEGI